MILIVLADELSLLNVSTPFDSVDLLPFDAATHLPLLEAWLRRPHVARWFGAPEFHLDFARQLPPGGDHALISLASAPVGYLRWQAVTRETLDAVGLPEIPAGAVDIDLFIGEPAHMGRGIGRRALELLLARLRADPTVPLAGLTTSIENTPALHAFARVGFRRVRQYSPPGYGVCWLMVADVTQP
jgi:RimJ/RimL family protein N-acetyltransferase